MHCTGPAASAQSPSPSSLPGPRSPSLPELSRLGANDLAPAPPGACAALAGNIVIAGRFVGVAGPGEEAPPRRRAALSMAGSGRLCPAAPLPVCACAAFRAAACCAAEPPSAPLRPAASDGSGSGSGSERLPVQSKGTCPVKLCTLMCIFTPTFNIRISRKKYTTAAYAHDPVMPRLAVAALYSTYESRPYMLMATLAVVAL